MDHDPTTAGTVTVKAVYCPGSNQEEIRRFNFPLPDTDADCLQLYDELRRRIAAVCSTATGPSSGCTVGEGLSLYYVDADQERVRFSTSEELAQLLRLHQATPRGSGPQTTLRILAEPAVSTEADGVEHPGVRCDGCKLGIRGRRFRCFLCPNYDLCQRCILRGVHDQHSMLVLHRPGDADSLPPWIARFGLGACGGGGGGGGGRGGGFGSWMWGGGPSRHFPWQQAQAQQQQSSPFPTPMPGCAPMPPQHPMMGMGMPPQHSMMGMGVPAMPPMSVACPKLARKMEKARRQFEAKMAKRCDRLQRKWARRQQQPQRPDGAAGTADEPIRIDVEEQCQQRQQQQQILCPEEAMLLKQLKKRHKQSAGGAAAAAKKKKKHSHHSHHKKGGRKRRRSRSSSSDSSDSDSDSSVSSESSSDSSSDSDAGSAEQKSYRQLLKKFRKMGFKDDETCWLRDLIREKKGNLNDILDAIRQRRAEAAGKSV